MTTSPATTPNDTNSSPAADSIGSQAANDLDTFFGDDTPAPSADPNPEAQPAAAQPAGAQTPAANPASGEQPTPVASAQPQPNTPVAQPAPVAADPNAQPQQAQPGAAPTPEEIRAIVQAEMGAQGKPTTEQPQTQPQATIDDVIPDYAGRFQIPDQVATLLNSEDPAERMTGTKHIAVGVMRAVHKEVLSQVQTMMQGFAQQLPEFIQVQSRQADLQRQVQGDFFKEFPMLKNPALAPVIKQAWEELSVAKKAEIEAKGWTPELCKSIGEKVFSLIGMPMPTQQPAPQAQPAPVAPPVFNGTAGQSAGRSPNPTNQVSPHTFDLD